MEDLAFDRAPLEDGAVLAAEPVEAGGEQSLDGGWQGELGQLARRRQRAVPAEQQPLVDEHGDHLLDEERVALGRIGDSNAHVVGELGRAEQVRDQALRRFVARVVPSSSLVEF